MPKEVTDPELLKQLNAPPKEVSDPDVLRQLHGPEPESRTWQVVRGAGRGLAGVIQRAGEILPDPMDMMGLRPTDERSVKARKQASEELHKFTDAPSASGWETGGRIAGQTLPFAFMPGVGATSTLGSIAERAAIGGVAGGLQPTEAHTAASHLPGAIAGAVTGGAGRAIGGRGSGLAGALSTRGVTHAGLTAVMVPYVESAFESMGLSKGQARTAAGVIAASML